MPAVKSKPSTANQAKTNSKSTKATSKTPKDQTAHKIPPVVFIDTQRELAKIQEILGCPVLSYFKPSGTSIWSRDLYAIWECLKHIGKVEKLAIYVRSDGGSGMISLRIIHLLRNYVKELIILAPSECASAATMLALGCDEIHLGPLSSLSAVDSSLIHPLSPVDAQDNPVSVSQDELWRVLRLWKDYYQGDESVHYSQKIGEELNLKKFDKGFTPNPNPEIKLGYKSDKNKVSPTDKHIDFEPDKETGMENPYKYLYQYVHPLVFGAIDRSRSLSVQLCHEILEYHISDPAKIQEISDKLNYTYPAHGYPITMREAKKIGLNVKAISDEIQVNLNNLQLLYGELTDEMISDYDNNSYHNQSIYSVIETTGVQIVYQNNFDKFYRENEKRYITLNDLSGWHKTTKTKLKVGKKETEGFKTDRLFI